MNISNARVALWLGLVLALWLNYETWLKDYGPKLESPAVAAATNAAGAAHNAASAAALANTIPGAAPSAAIATTSANSVDAPAPALPGIAPTAANAAAGSVHVRTDVLDLDISLQGGALLRADLLQYPLIKGEATPVRLLNNDPQGRYNIQTGLAGPAGSARPTHLAAMLAAQQDYSLGKRDDELKVPLTWSDAAGVNVTKTFVFKRGQYRVDVQYDVHNDSAAPWQAASYAQILRDNIVPKRSMFNVDSYSFKGPAYDDGTKYQKLSLDKAEDRNLNRDIQAGWIAGMEHHFVTAVVPPADVSYHYSLSAQGTEYLLSMSGPLQTIAPGASKSFQETLFIGPKLQRQLAPIATRLPYLTDYGKYLGVLSRPLFSALDFVHRAVNNWGLAIILVTLLLKLVFYPLSEASGKSMAKMRVLAPRIKSLQETYKDNKEQLGKKTMELYQKEKVNPLAGCLPMLIQMPVFFAFYWMLLESVEMRQAPFFGWITDISSKDPYYILPAIMAVAMFVQYKLNPAPPDPVQAKVFMILPLVMSVTFAFFPAGLVLYWVTNTVLSIAQQWNINRRIEAAGLKPKAA